jgi:hypothetical protein
MSDRMLIAVDPGVVTGFAYWNTISPPLAWEMPEDEAMDFIVDDIHAKKYENESLLVVCEDFKPRPGAITFFPASLHQIGFLRHTCRRAGVPFRLQTPAAGKAFGTDSKLKKIGWHRIAMDAYRPDITSHPQSLDALRHLLLASVKIGLVDAELLL